MNIALDLTVDEVNGILNALGDLPTKAGVWPLVEKIRAQAIPQVTQEVPIEATVEPLSENYGGTD